MSINDIMDLFMAKDDGNAELAINRTAEIVRVGMEYAKNIQRKNDEWDIVWAMPLPENEGERSCEIVIGDRHTQFEPFVAWHCFDRESYAWGHYCNTFGGAFEEAIEKLRKELGM